MASASWRPTYDWSDPDATAKYIEAILDKAMAPGVNVKVVYRLERAGTNEHCVADFGENGTCYRKAKVVVVTTVENGLKQTKRTLRTPACSPAHITRRVRDYFGIPRWEEKGRRY